ncbi:phosphoribosylglycinamide formyltransferase-1 [Nocardia kruczakiae]|uniref:Phosphoribosylglycinamide formyltransferase n=1 Tax=Nocardia kruczakiae TaxID=261477 RepID=A0ABU1XE58_9NOCA|nr:phosphoribosylglycinamide formyltransferase [Nocardia kruczakiae]MDR7168826.1 phosphoribosylglycinamide formyltransferase-1 [Nocardia kruczakiae]
MRNLRVGVLVSHHGSNLRALHRSSLEPGARFEIAVVIGNNSDAVGLAYARENRIPTRHLSGATHPDPDALDEAIRAALAEHTTDWVVTAGYMKKLGPRTRRHFDSRILNIHPAPLPRFGGAGMFGQRVHDAVLASGVAVTGPTVHLVDADYDTGRVLAHREVPVLADDTVETLAARVLEAEHVVLPLVVRRIAAGERI